MTKPTSLLNIEFDIPAYWNDDQVIAVLGLLDELREKILDHYRLQIIDAFDEYDSYPPNHEAELDPDDIPF